MNIRCSCPTIGGCLISLDYSWVFWWKDKRFISGRKRRLPVQRRKPSYPSSNTPEHIFFLHTWFIWGYFRAVASQSNWSSWTPWVSTRGREEPWLTEHFTGIILPMTSTGRRDASRGRCCLRGIVVAPGESVPDRSLGLITCSRPARERGFRPHRVTMRCHAYPMKHDSLPQYTRHYSIRALSWDNMMSTGLPCGRELRNSRLPEPSSVVAMLTCV